MAQLEGDQAKTTRSGHVTSVVIRVYLAVLTTVWGKGSEAGGDRDAHQQERDDGSRQASTCGAAATVGVA